MRTARALYSVMIVMFAWNIFTLFRITRAQDPWQMGDWLINYSGGFVRRGLSGEIVLNIAGLLHLPVDGLFFVLLAAAYGAFFWLFYLLVRHRDKPFWLLLMVASPATFLFTLNSSVTIARKELLFLILLAWWVLRLRDKPEPDTHWKVLMAAGFVAGAALTLMHELFVFYAPYFLLAPWLLRMSEASPITRTATARAYAVGIMVCVGAGLATIGLMAYGMEFDNRAICDRILDYDLEDKVCDNVVDWPVRRIGEAIAFTLEFAVTHGYAMLYGVCFLLGMVPFSMMLWQEKQPPRVPYGSRITNTFATVMVIGLLLSLPLFATAIDWGRFLHIHFMAWMILATMFLSRTMVRTSSGFATATLAGFMALLYVTTWGMPHCCFNRADGIIDKALIRLEARELVFCGGFP